MTRWKGVLSFRAKCNGDPESSLYNHIPNLKCWIPDNFDFVVISGMTVVMWIPDNPAPGGDFRNDSEGATASGMTIVMSSRTVIRVKRSQDCFGLENSLAMTGQAGFRITASAVSGMTYNVRPCSSIRVQCSNHARHSGPRLPSSA